MSKAIIDQIDVLKHLMVLTAEKHGYDFQHPDIQKISKELDALILIMIKEQMKEKNASASLVSSS